MPEAYDIITPFACRSDKCSLGVQLLRGRPRGVSSQAFELRERKIGITPFDCPRDKGSPLDNLAGANVTDLRGFVLVRKRCCAGTPNCLTRTLQIIP
jgi:hypothetical protein